MNDSANNFLMNQAANMVDMMVDYKEMMMVYACAIKEIKTKFEVLNLEFRVRYKRNPISSIQDRLKSQTSTMEKMQRLNLPITTASIEANISDIAGVRVICAYIDDIYFIAKALSDQTDIKILERKDYIADPKPNGYRSLHLIIQVPVFFCEMKKTVKVEVQIRTIAMDFWASLEHQMKYKHRFANEEQIVRELKSCADTINDTDQQMQQIRTEIERSKNKPSQEEQLLEKIKKVETMLE